MTNKTYAKFILYSKSFLFLPFSSRLHTVYLVLSVLSVFLLTRNRRLPREYIPHRPEELGEALARHQQQQRQQRQQQQKQQQQKDQEEQPWQLVVWQPRILEVALANADPLRNAAASPSTETPSGGLGRGTRRLWPASRGCPSPFRRPPAPVSACCMTRHTS